MDEFKRLNGPEVRLPFDNCCDEETNMCKILRQIKKDVPRTSSTFNNDHFELPLSTGKNPVFNILSAYAEQDPELGYTQGMNFIAAILYVAVQDEVLSFTIMQRLMQSKQ